MSIRQVGQECRLCYEILPLRHIQSAPIVEETSEEVNQIEDMILHCERLATDLNTNVGVCSDERVPMVFFRRYER